ncbi:MAG: hypothetical protein AAF587_38355 [Bacteroidota bacterium]
MRIFSCLLVFLLSSQFSAISQERGDNYLGSTDVYEFYAPYWFNLHHFLQYEALLRSVVDSSIISKATLQHMSSTEKAALEAAISYYQEHLVEKNLRSNPYQSAFKQWIVHQDSMQLENIPPEFRHHCEHLQKVTEGYRNHFWNTHRQSIRTRLRDNLQLINDTEEKAVDRLTELTRSYWKEGNIRVDICYYGSASAYNLRPRPYTTLSPVHVVMNAMPSTDIPHGSWLELLYHESSHHLISSKAGFVAGSIGDASGFPNQKAPRDLWHAYLFYFSGVVTQDLLHEQGITDYSLYMVRKRVFSSYFPHLQAHLPAYMRFEDSLYEVSKRIIADFQASRK